MKFTIEGFNQEYAVSLQKKIIENDKEKIIKLDCIDLVILRWIVDFEPNMSKKIIDNETYFWVNYQSLLEALPILNMKKRMLFYRLDKMCVLNILKHKNVKEKGNYSYYAFDRNYKNLVQKNANGMQNIAEPSAENCLTLMQNIAEQNNSSIKETHLLNNSITPYNPPKGESENLSTTAEDGQNEIDEYNFKIFWDAYPRKEGRTKAFGYFKQWVRGRKINGKTIKLTDMQIYDAVLAYAKEKKYTETKYIQQGSTFFNTTILDYVDME